MSTSSESTRPATPSSPPAPQRARAAASPHPLVARAADNALLLRRIVLLLGVSVVLGGLSGLVWNASTRLPTYTIASDGSASITERGLAGVFSSDAGYCLTGLVAGLLLGLVTWWWFGRRGALVVPLAAVSALLASLVCWWIGVLVGPDGFAVRISGARAGDVVPIDLALRSWTPVLVWPFAALLPVLVMSLLGWDAAERRVRSSRPVAPAEVTAPRDGSQVTDRDH